MGLLSWIEKAISRGEYDSPEDYCNQNGCNLDDIYDYDEDETNEDEDW